MHSLHKVVNYDIMRNMYIQSCFDYTLQSNYSCCSLIAARLFVIAAMLILPSAVHSSDVNNTDQQLAWRIPIRRACPNRLQTNVCTYFTVSASASVQQLPLRAHAGQGLPMLVILQSVAVSLGHRTVTRTEKPFSGALLAFSPEG